MTSGEEEERQGERESIWFEMARRGRGLAGWGNLFYFCLFAL